MTKTPLAPLLAVLCFASSPAISADSDEVLDKKIYEHLVSQSRESHLPHDVIKFKRSETKETKYKDVYRIVHTYQLLFRENYGESVLDWAKRINKTMSELPDTIFISENAIANIKLEGWMRLYPEGIESRKVKILERCEPCRTYWASQDDPEQAEGRRRAFMRSMQHHEEQGFYADGPGDTEWSYISLRKKTPDGWVQIP